ncbi:MAG: GWxTD domain-containing protein [Ignavibacteriaceae bacterium]|nr:GWxTD domain-containing protein [Ignavibacteriaceae bacterium]
MKYLIILLSFVLFSALVYSQVENFDKNSVLSSEPTYYQEFLNFHSGKEGITRVDVYLQIPYSSIQFIKSPQGFTAKYAVTASVYDTSQTRLIVEKSWNETINVIDFNQTIAKENYNLTMRSFELAPGNYFIRTMIEDRDSRREYTSGNKLTVRDFDSLISVSDVMFISGSRVIDGVNQVIPNISRNIIGTEKNIQIYFEIYSKDSSEQKIPVEYNVLEANRKTIFYKQEDYIVKEGKNHILSSLDDVNIDLGSYVLNVAIFKSDGDKTISLDKQFFSRWRGLPANIVDIDKAVEQMVYIATPDELSYIEKAESPNEKLKRFLEYWKAKDPSPNNDENEMFAEYYSRVKYTNDNFSSYREGWKSDRGMVFIILGPPNNIDRHPFEYYSKPYEVWEYYTINRSFTFIDETGFGDYRLTTPLTGDLFRYRP